MVRKVRKALKICSDGNTCRECPYYDCSAKCLYQLHDDVLEVMNNISDKGIREFTHYLIDSAHDGVIKVSDMPELVIKFTSEQIKQELKCASDNKIIFNDYNNLVFIDYEVSTNCANSESYGAVCLKCGKCGRIFTNGILTGEVDNDDR